MSRQIKFRAWDKHLKKFYFDSDTLHIAGNKIFVHLDQDKRRKSYFISAADCEFSQFTGLQDKAGRDIYEGDVVKDRFGRIMQVQWWNFRLCWVAISETNFHHADLYDWVDYDEQGNHNGVARVEVIGNIYESPHLLNPTA